MTNMTKYKRLTLSFVVETPPQWKAFTTEYPTQYECSLPNKRTILTPTRWRLMCAIQREVSTLAKYKRDPKGNDHWRLLFTEWGLQAGDCEDIALTKRAMLLVAGFPMGAVWPVICKKTRLDEPHVVTVVSTLEKDYVMDITPNWVHDARDSTLEWLTAYDGAHWRVATM